jgi:hypothetical protein
MTAVVVARIHDTRLQAAMEWLKTICKSPKYGWRDKQSALLVRVAVLDRSETVAPETILWLRNQAKRGDPVHRGWCERLLKEIE